MDNKYAGFWIRWFAQLTHASISFCFSMGLFFLITVIGVTSGVDFLYSILWFFVILGLTMPIFNLFLNAFLISSLGASFGKLAYGLRITREDGKNLTLKNALFRENIAKIASNALLGIGYYWIFRNDKRQAWHDSLAETYVIKANSQGIFTGLTVLILTSILTGFFIFKSYTNISTNDTLKFDIATLFTQGSQDLTNTDFDPTTLFPE